MVDDRQRVVNSSYTLPSTWPPNFLTNIAVKFGKFLSHGLQSSFSKPPSGPLHPALVALQITSKLLLSTTMCQPPQLFRLLRLESSGNVEERKAANWRSKS
ncbi:hypothetical protein QL285_082988 [Trifolium repens]|nr:hypothetical protein QL285_082988 [Trifolium repens]